MMEEQKSGELGLEVNGGRLKDCKSMSELGSGSETVRRMRRAELKKFLFVKITHNTS